MRAVPVHLYPVFFHCIDVSAKVRAAVNAQTFPARRAGFMSKHRAEKPCADDQIIISHLLFFFPFALYFSI